jgi:glutathione synthase/RimK-type ligase-like ATP-grasp enzyme
MKIALPTCSTLPDWEVDDARFHEALIARGVDVHRPVWDDDEVDWSGFDGCLIRTTWDYQEKRDAFVAWAERVAKVTKFFNPPDIVRWNTHKKYLLELESKGIAIAPTVWFDPGDETPIEDIMREREWRRAFLKPAIAASARGTFRFDDDADGIAAATKHLCEMLANEESMLMQPYLSSVETEGEYSVVLFDGEYSHGVQKIPVAGDYRVQDDYGASDKPWHPCDDDISLAKRIAETVDGDLLYARVDFLRSDSGELLLNELELVEPSLFFRHSETAARMFAEAVCGRIG